MAELINKWWEFKPSESVMPNFNGFPEIFNVGYYDKESFSLEKVGPFTILKIWSTLCNEIFIQFLEIPGTFRAFQFRKFNYFQSLPKNVHNILRDL